METLKTKWNNLPLRRFFMLTVLLAIGIVVLLSALVIGACAAFRHWLLPDPDAVYLTIEETLDNGEVLEGIYFLKFGDDLSSLPSISIEYDDEPVSDSVAQTRYSIQKIESSVDSLTPKRRVAYEVCGVAMFAAPTILAFLAILLSSMFFYRHKLKEPFELLAGATRQIADQNLDFEIVYNCGDEMGDLCRSFEDMRSALYENKKAMWNMLEERQMMQASVAHDLRNPIAIIEGYAEYLETNLKNGEISRGKLARIVQNLGVAAKRMERYTESVRLLNQSEETKLNRKSVSALKLADGIAQDLTLLAGQRKLALRVTNNLPDKEIQVDTTLFYRILENIVNNALRYARTEICLDFSLTDRMLFAAVTDDGDGFLPEILNKKSKLLLIPGEDGHMGIGLSVSRLFCQKHGGRLELSNTSRGACVKIFLSV